MFYSDLCDIQRRGVTTQAYGSKPAYTEHKFNVRCRLSAKRKGGFNSVTGEWVIITEYRLMLPRNTDIEEGDRVVNIRQKGDSAIRKNFQVDGGALQRRGRSHRHKTVILKQVT
jgi:hypothetical protein